VVIRITNRGCQFVAPPTSDGFRAIDGDHHHRIFIGADTKPVVVEGNDTGRAGPNHPHINPLPQAHFFESNDKIVRTFNLVNATLFAGAEKFEGDKLLQVTVSRRVTGDWQLGENIETQSQVWLPF
jgi:hypothetical protein